MKHTYKNLILSLFAFCLLFLYLDFQLTNFFSQQTNTQSVGLKHNLLVLMVVVGILFYFVLYYYRSKNQLIKAFTTLLFFVVFNSFLLSFFYSRSSITLYLTILLPLLSLLFINSALEQLGDLKVLKILSVIVILLGVRYFLLYNNTSLFLGTDSFVTNASYMLLLFLPMVLTIENKLIKFSIIIMIVIAVLFSAKRGGIIALGLSLFMFVLFSNVGKKKRFRITPVLLSLIVLSVVAYYLFLWVDTLGNNMLIERFLRMKASGGSGREDIYKETFNMIFSSDFPSFVLGHGWNGVLRDSPLEYSAHNDFLEVQYDFGFFVFLIYLYSYYCTFKQFIKMVKSKSVYSGQFSCAITIMITLSMVSHIIITPSLCMIEMMVFSYLVHIDKSYNNENRSISVPISD